VSVAWIGHATVLINFHGVTILTDPVFGKRVGPNLVGRLTVGARRITELPLEFAELPPIDLVLLSHAHYDHWDMASLKRFRGQSDLVIPHGNEDLIPEGRFRHVTPLGEGEARRIGRLTIAAFATNHWGRRPLRRKRPRGFNGYVISGLGSRILFGGDSAYVHDLCERAGGPADLCILGIGCYDPHVRKHATPEQAWGMFKQVQRPTKQGGSWLLPIHWRTFLMTREPVMEPMQRLLRAAGGEAERIVCRAPGEAFVLPE
jgi:L-ascorbate metabolism protein UlaG (beta-lactamase superfamily)